MPDPVIESPDTRAMNVADGRWIKSLRSSTPSEKSSAGLGNPAGTCDENSGKES